MLQVNLGGIVLQDLEVPEVIPWGGDQALAVQKQIGGARTIDAMGRDDIAIEWEGVFLYATAFDRAQALNTLRIAGQQVTLTWGQLNFEVVLRTFVADFRNLYHIPYRIVCEVVQDNATPSTPSTTVDIDDQMTSDLTTANGLTTQINDSTLSGLMGTVTSAVKAVSTFANASSQVIASVVQPIAAAQTQVGALLGQAIATTQNIATVGGVLPNNPISQNVNALAAQAAAFTQAPVLVSLQGVLGRMAGNAYALGTNTSTQTVAGGDLRILAANQYGDATSWTAIAKANGLTDPQINGLATLLVPNQPDTAGGLLGV